MQNLDATLQKFEKAARQKLNKEKCRGLWIGRNKNKTTGPLGLNWTETKIQTLGLTFPNDETDDITGNWNRRTDKFEEKAKHWEKLNLSLKGKITVINTLILSKLRHTAQCIPLPNKQHIDKTLRPIYNFLWNV